MKLLLSLFLLFLAPLAAAAAVVLELKDEQTMLSGTITLNDLLQSSQGLSQDDLSLVLATSPALGQSETWTRDQIANLLPDTIKQQLPQWTGAASISIKRPAASFGEPETRQLITGELAHAITADCKYEVLELAGFHPFLIPQGEVETRVELSNGALRNEWGEASLQ